MSNLDDIPAIDLYPPPEAPGYYRSESPDILRVSAAQPDETTLEGMEFGADARSLRRAPYETPLSPTPGCGPGRRSPSTADTEYDPGYYLQKIKKRPLSVSLVGCVFILVDRV